MLPVLNKMAAATFEVMPLSQCLLKTMLIHFPLYICMKPEGNSMQVQCINILENPNSESSDDDSEMSYTALNQFLLFQAQVRTD